MVHPMANVCRCARPPVANLAEAKSVGWEGSHDGKDGRMPMAAACLVGHFELLEQTSITTSATRASSRCGDKNAKRNGRKREGKRASVARLLRVGYWAAESSSSCRSSRRCTRAGCCAARCRRRFAVSSHRRCRSPYSRGSSPGRSGSSSWVYFREHPRRRGFIRSLHVPRMPALAAPPAQPDRVTVHGRFQRHHSDGLARGTDRWHAKRDRTIRHAKQDTSAASAEPIHRTNYS
jgi:hypothetical protein